ncbi:MAG: transketolase, partial [Gemmatimonadota bacterium]
MESVDQLFVDTLRFLAADAVEKAGSGHPGMPLDAAPMAYMLWSRFLKHNPTNPDWPNRDRFVLSAGHGSALLYALLHLNGYDVPLEEIERLRQWGSITPGHPEKGRTPCVEVTTGPLGQGFGMAVGLAIAERMLAERFNTDEHTIVDHCTWVIASDGDVMEGITYEASSLAGHLGLGKLICFYDENRVTIDGSADLAFSDDVGRRFDALGWHVQRVRDGNDLAGIDRAIRSALDISDQPSLIRVSTHLGYGSPKQDQAVAHGKPLGEEALEQTKRNLGWPTDARFYVPDEVAEAGAESVRRGAELERRWRKRLDEYRERSPELAEELDRRLAGGLPAAWPGVLEGLDFGDDPMATRDASHRVLNALEDTLPELIGGSADLASS